MDPFGGRIVWEVTFIAIATIIWSILTTGGNLLVIISFIINKNLRIVTNYFIVSLATADFLIGLVTINLYSLFIILNCWPLGDIVCNLWLVMDYGGCQASVISLVLICMDRYFIISRPMTYSAWRTKKIAKILIILAWILAMITWVPLIYIYPVATNKTLAKGECIALFLNGSPEATLLTHVLGYFLPVIIIGVQYKRMHSVIKEKEKSLKRVQFLTKDLRSMTSLPSVDTTTTTFQSSSTSDEDSNGVDLHVECEDGFANNMGRIMENNDQVGKGHNEDSTAELNDDHVNLQLETNAKKWKSVIKKETDYTEISTGIHANGSLVTASSQGREDTRSPCHQGEIFCKEIILDTNEENSQGHNCYHGEAFCVNQDVKSPDFKGSQPDVLVVHSGSSCTPLEKGKEDNKNTNDCIMINSAASKVSEVQDNLSHERKLKSLSKHKRVARMIFLVVITYVIFWLPYELFAMIRPFCSNCIPDVWWSFSYGFAYVNSTANPFCYTFANKKFRETFKKILCFVRRGGVEETTTSGDTGYALNRYTVASS